MKLVPYLFLDVPIYYVVHKIQGRHFRNIKMGAKKPWVTCRNIIGSLVKTDPNRVVLKCIHSGILWLNSDW